MKTIDEIIKENKGRCNDCVHNIELFKNIDNKYCRECSHDVIPEVCNNNKCSIEGCIASAKYYISGVWYCKEHGLNVYFRR